MAKKSATTPPCFIQPEDAALFRAAIGIVNPLPEQNRIAAQTHSRKLLYHRPVEQPKIADNLSDFASSDAPEDFVRNGLSRMDLRKLRRGNWPVQDVLDLHGNNRDAARKLLQEFLHEATQYDRRCVLVIHGKGMNSPGGTALLRQLTRNWLLQHPRVLGYCNATPKQGGSGASLVLLSALKGAK